MSLVQQTLIDDGHKVPGSNDVVAHESLDVKTTQPHLSNKIQRLWYKRLFYLQ